MVRQTVWMEPVDKTHITEYYPVSNLAKSLLTIDVKTANVEGKVYGLMTYDRAVIKVDIPKLAEINRSVIESMSK